jgi:hypothetical protein
MEKYMETENTGPFLLAAVLCERILQERHEVLSIVRMTDRIAVTTYAAESPKVMLPTPIALQALIALKAGSAEGNEIVKLRTVTPSGELLPDLLFPVLFEGEDRGVNIIVTLNMVMEEEGVYWFEVVLHEKILTRIPLRILYQRLCLGM